MARQHRSQARLQFREARAGKMALGNRRFGLIFGLIAVAVLALAWFDGGEEPIRPIRQDIPVPEGA